MTDSNNANSSNWRSKQIWIKDVLSKSGTELTEITRGANQRKTIPSSLTIVPSTSKTPSGVKNGASRETNKKSNVQDPPSKMVYYPSTPLITKTDQSSQAQFCTPLRAVTSASTASTSNVHQQLLPIHAQHQNSISTVPQDYNHQNIDTGILQQHQQLKQKLHQSPQSTSITKNATGNGYQPQQQQHQQQQQQQHQHQQNYLLTSIKAEQLPPSITLYATTSTKTAQPGETIELTSSLATLTPVSTIGGGGGGRKSVAPTAAGSKPQFKCEQCGMTFGSKSAHTSHTKSHAKSEMSSGGGLSGGSLTTNPGTQTSSVELNESGVPVGIPKSPQIIPNSVAGSDPYQCNVCQKTFAVPARLIRHYRTHTGERPFECEFCHKLFSVKENLQVHRRIHTKERPYKCDVCGRAFEHSGKLHRHMRIHTGERPHKCSVCEKTFIQSGQLVIHMRTHTGEKPYKCPVEGCGKGFTCSKQLKVHSRTHTGEKPYQCDICYRDFGYNHVLKLHRVQHYGSKCYKCTICDKTFKSKKEMEAHIKGHANEMPDGDDDDDGETVASAVAGAASCSPSSSGGEMTNSSPGSPPLSPERSATYANATKIRKPPRQPRAPRAAAAMIVNQATKQPPSPSSPSSTYSPPSSVASASRLSAGSPPSPAASPDIASSGLLTTIVPSASQTIETDMHYNSRDSGVVTNCSAGGAFGGNQRQLNLMSSNASASAYGNVNDLPTDLSIGQPTHAHTKVSSNYYAVAQQASPTHYTYLRQRSPSPSPSQSPAPMSEAPTINPALLEAATIAREEEAALQILQLRRSQQMQKPQPAHCNVDFAAAANSASVESELVQQNEDLHEANELIAHYKRGELARHGLHKRYAPVPKFESTILSNENLVRKVEAAIAPLRSSTESPERSSSPECDSIILVSDRDVMTLPLRKRKLYMQEEQTKNGDSLKATHPQAPPITAASGANDSSAASQKVMRMSSVIQFAKAS